MFPPFAVTIDAVSRPTVICAVCGGLIKPQACGPVPTYCGDTCRQRAWRRRHPLGDQLVREWGLEESADLSATLAAHGVVDLFA